VSEGEMCSQSFGIDSPVSPRPFVDKETHPRYFGLTDEIPYIGRYDHIPARSVYISSDSGMKDVLDLIAKRFDTLDHRKYFPCPIEVEKPAKITAGSDENSAALAATRAAASTDTASKSAIASAPACQSTVAATMKLSAL